MKTLDKKSTKNLTKEVLNYYKKHRRVLPWRENPQPYYVWLSEIMLQQTRVETVIPYFNRFVATFPKVRDLAEGSEETLMKLWEGLGYYSRARNLQKAAKVMMERYGGQLPSNKEELMQLPGIGPYTAGAISSIAFGKRETAVDGNLIRVASRLIAYGDSVVSADGKKKIEAFWKNLLPEKGAGDFNQAIMDIGATICLPNGLPLCEKCPMNNDCISFQQGNPLDYPKKEIKKKRRMEAKTVFMIYDGKNIALEKRENEGLLAGLWQFPTSEGHLQGEEEAMAWLSQQKLSAMTLRKGPQAKHIFSHIEWQMISWVVRLDEFMVCETREEKFSWIPTEEINEITLPTAFQKFRREVEQYKG